uniref:Uncharacterized protein n=1 Tax=Globodera rostochiensis TaxID=31243 RepID=A0A914IC11_GLORO
MDKPAVPEQKADESVKEKKKRTAKKRCEQKDELMSEQKVDKFINIRQEIETKCQEIEDEVLDINLELDSCVDKLRMYDQCLDQAVRLEQRLLSHVIFDDVDDTAQQNDLIDVIQSVDPIMITNSGLEPLNVKLTDFINNPVLHCIDSNADTAATRSRTVTSTDHISPTFDDIKSMVEDIRAQGDCPRVDVLAPADNSTVYDQFVCKVLADLLDILKRKRYFTNLEQIERHVQDRQGQAETANGEELKASGLSEQHDEMTASTAETSTHEKILEAIQKGELQTEGEDAVADGEDVGEAEDDESHSEAGSDDFTDSVSSTCAVALQQHIVKADDDVVAMENVQQQSSLSSNSSPCTDGLPSTSQPSSSATNAASLTSSSAVKVRLQQHQLNKLFSSAARLRSSPPLEPSLSTLKPDLIDLTLEDNGDNDDEKRSEISERTDGHDELSNDDDDDSDTVMAVADSSDLEIIEELNEDNDDEWPVETVSDASTIPTDALEEAKAMLNGGGRRKRKSEDEESDVEVNRKKRTKEAIEDTVMVDDDDEDVVVEDVGADDIDLNDEEEEKAVKPEQNAVLVVDAADHEDDEAPEAKKAEDDNGHQLMDEESIIYLSDG